MQQLQAYLDQLAPYRDLLFSLSVVLLTLIVAIYALLSVVQAGTVRRVLAEQRALIGEMRQQGAALTRPYVDIRAALDPVTLLIFLQIRNNGRSPARDVRLTLDKPFYQFGQKREERNIARFHAFAQTLPTLSPGQELTFHLGSGSAIFGDNRRDELTPQVFSVHARYFAGDTPIEEATGIDLRALLMNATMATPLKQEMEALNKNVHDAAAALQQMARAYDQAPPATE